MTSIQTSQDMFIYELGDIYDAEHRFLKGQQEMLTQASDATLQGMIQHHIEQTQGHIKNLEDVFSLLGQNAKRQSCDAAAGLVDEAQKTMKDTKVDAVRDCVIAGAADKVEHYEIASYRGLITGAQMMGQQQVMSLLQQNLQQEEQTAQLIERSTPQLLQTAMQAEGMKVDTTAGTIGQETMTRM